MSDAISPLAPKTYPDMPAVRGARLATASAGIKYAGRTDVLLLLFDEGTEVAGVFTRSRCPSAAVDWCRANLSAGKARALLVNSGNANAFTGRKGVETTRLSAQFAAEAAQCAPEDVFLASTGVIGEPLDATKFNGVLGAMAQQVAPTGWLDAARAIMTTDTFPKAATRSVELGGVRVTLNGIAKGAGMVAPDMATMLSFLVTDAPIAAPVLQALLAETVGPSFNSITIDGDTSTSDTVLLFATGAAGGGRVETLDDPRLPPFRAALADLMRELAQWIVRDGEGASKFLEVTVRGAESDASARKIGFSIANSPLVKTAIAGEDANWGRVVMAVGKAGEPAERDRLAIWFGDVRVAVDGERDAGYAEAAATAVMRREEIQLTVDLGIGTGRATVWTCDLTKEYVAINGDYRS
ncbi:bifunctional glutamate N-acetyltransferase/amino-acid acetyltransferase ArgJ [Stappia sp. ES.058]|uniref:bifunctional glutamate N-acetyltransferase/amino-acid acetyltransferase ArgJ n=1 Tax=Stappia sp. ES.058 TaxID=1881061 RepID=UPI00087DACFF|nr:bifunctional glutamate N-acetyltransferase/amino-acid acetyltransferase ArgJ [Stappia sp. ES.058]SDU37812.1 glutamate N-acetyltransferase [Stappia sp. ES.058]